MKAPAVAMSISVLLVLCIAGHGTPAAERSAPPRDAVDRAIPQAVKYVLSCMDEQTGLCRDEYPEDDIRYGEKTLLCIYALLSAEVDYRTTPKLQSAIRWALKTEFRGVAAVAWRAMALSILRDDRAEPYLKNDAQWLIRAGGSDGAYGDGFEGPATPRDRNNYNGYLAVLGVSAASRRGVAVPEEYWRRIASHWRSIQQDDGGWGYLVHRAGEQSRAFPYGSMTAAGVVTLSICQEQSSRTSAQPGGTEAHYRAWSRAWEWLEDHYSIEINPRRGPEWYYHWMFNLQQLGRITGRRYIGNADWYRQGMRELLRRQRDDGSFSFGPRSEATCLALLFLAQGRAPVLFNKIRYPGSWNTRPRDIANAVRWLGYTYERGLGWQVIDIASRRADWDDGRVLYLSGAGPVEFSSEQIDVLRTFVYRGGMILSEAAGNDGDFTLDMHKMYQRLFPNYRLERIAETHPIYTLSYTDVRPKGLLGVYNGVRLLAVHSPSELSRDWQLGADESRLPTFHLAANLYLYLTENGRTSPRGEADWPEPAADEPTRIIRLARLSHEGNADPEPLAMDRLGRLLRNRFDTALQTSTPMPPRRLDARQWPVAHMTGTGDFTLSDRDRQALRTYFRSGGTLLADAAGGSEAFAKAFLREIVTPLGPSVRLPGQSPFYAEGPYDVSSVRYRAAAAEEMVAEDRTRPSLQVVYLEERPAVIFSSQDLTAGLVGYPLAGMDGYRPEDARRVMTNLLWHLSGFGGKPSESAGATSGQE